MSRLHLYTTMSPVSSGLQHVKQLICTELYTGIIIIYKIFFRKCRFVSLPGGQILNIDALDHWPMPRDAS